jgi:hypothetical protein
MKESDTQLDQAQAVAAQPAMSLVGLGMPHKKDALLC